MAKVLATVTGASSGIGFELARRFADDGYNLILAADEDVIHACADKLAATGVDVMAVQGDLRKPDEVERLYRIATEGGRRLDAAALNAGVDRAGPFLEGDLQEDRGIVDLDVRSTFTWQAGAARHGIARNRQGSVHVLDRRRDARLESGRCTTLQAFVQSFAEALHDELRPTGVAITSLMPGPTETNFFRRAGIADTVIGRMPKDAPERVAKQGYAAMMRDDRTVLAASLFSKAMGITNWFVPDSVKAAANRLIVARTGSH